ncbi:site-specific integrase [Lysinibacillus fusiformis]|uniref:site-specific integrase n=1 Tax=Lysinibacillus fusiformis TaxID=28031 RepID=UPI001F4D5F49|nr:site-specific integrase [Lysinibacillus fusiformis]MCK1989361.1 site-specific integrase [Lysinibacillus fusiformis]
MTKKKLSAVTSYQTKKGETRYMFPVYAGVDPLTGKQKRTRRLGFKTRREAELALARIKLEIANGTFHQERAETYQEVYDLWLSSYEKTVEESTFVKTTGIFKNHILPAMGSYKIEKIHVDICQKHVEGWSMKLKNFRMVKSYAAKVLVFAMKRGYIQQNPFTLIDMPKSQKKPSPSAEVPENFYTKDQLNTFLSCLEKETNFKAYTFFRLLAFSGMRKGEAFALTWNDINFKKNEIKITKALSRGKDNRLYIKSTKTGDSRTVSMDEKTMGILKEWKKQQKLDYLKLGYNTMQPEQLVFSNKTNDLMQPTKSRKWLLHVVEKYKLHQITTHGLRHTHCSLLFEAGATLKEVQDRLGHSDAQTTMNIYAHVSQKARDGAIQKFENFLNM